MAQQAPVTRDDQTLLVLQYENDAFAAQDNGYTNGIRVGVIPGGTDAPGWLRGTAEAITPLSGLTSGSPWSWSVEQIMFTPNNIEDPHFPPKDRPYAGWLNLSASVFSMADGRLERFRISAGTVGPASGAEQVQKEIHELIGTNRPVGWETQLPNEPTLQLSYDRQWRMINRDLFDSLIVEFTPSAGGTLGNARTGAEVGGFVRIGDNIPVDFGPQRINALAGGSGYYKPTRGFGWYAYAGISGRYEPHNLFLDGSLFQTTPSVERDPWLGQAYFGFACYHGPTRVGLTHVVETDRFDNQRGNGRFGALTVSWRI